MPHAAPASTRFPEASIETQFPFVKEPVVVAKVEVFPDFEPTVTALAPAPTRGAPEVKDVAPVPPLPTGNVFVTSAVSETELKVGAPAALPCRTDAVVPSEPTMLGATPAPPPNTKRFAVNAALDERVAVVSKYGMPPDVPVVVSAIVPELVIGPPEEPKMLEAGTLTSTELTPPPPPAGVAQVPSPRQKVVFEAEVPLFKLVTGKLPDTSVAKATAPKEGEPEALP